MPVHRSKYGDRRLQKMRILTKITLFVALISVLVLQFYDSQLYSDYKDEVTVFVQDNVLSRPMVESGISTLHRTVETSIKPYLSEFEDLINVHVMVPSRIYFQKHEQIFDKMLQYYNWIMGRIHVLINDLRLNIVCKKLNGKMDIFFGKLRLVWYYLRGILCKSNMISNCEEEHITFVELLESLATDSTGSHSKKEDEEEEELEPEFDAAAIYEVERKSAQANTDLTIEDIKGNLQLQLDTWVQKIDKKSSKILQTLEKEVLEMVHSIQQELSPVLKLQLAELSTDLKSQYTKISKAIEDVNCTSEVDDTTGKVIYFDASGKTQLPEYVTKPMITKYMNETQNILSKRITSINQNLEEIVHEINEKIQEKRLEYLEIYEEWGEIMITELSKNIAYVEMMLDDTEEDNNMDHANWKRFMMLKRKIISTRDNLIHYELDLSAMDEFLQQYHDNVKSLNRDSIDFLKILNTKANIAFKQRDIQETQTETLPADEISEAMALL